MAKAPRYLVIDGYIQEAREQLVSGGASTAADLYCSMLIKCSPPGAECDVLFPSDAGASFPSDDQLAGYNGIAWTGCSLCLNDSHMPEVAKQIDLARLRIGREYPVLAAAGQRRLQWSPPADRCSPIRMVARWALPAKSSSPRPVGHIRCTRARRTFSMASRATTTRSPTFRLCLGAQPQRMDTSAIGCRHAPRRHLLGTPVSSRVRPARNGTTDFLPHSEVDQARFFYG